jgi:hypothetical protein
MYTAFVGVDHRCPLGTKTVRSRKPRSSGTLRPMSAPPLLYFQLVKRIRSVQISTDSRKSSDTDAPEPVPADLKKPYRICELKLSKGKDRV